MSETNNNTESAPAEEATTTEASNDTDVPELGDAGKKALADERKARREADKRTKELEARLATFEDANKSESEKLNERATKAEQRAADIEARWKSSQARQAITNAAITAQTIDAETVYLHIQAQGGVEVDDEGNVTGADKAVAALAKAKPHLFRSTPAGARDAHASTTPMALNSNALENALRSAVGA